MVGLRITVQLKISFIHAIYQRFSLLNYVRYVSEVDVYIMFEHRPIATETNVEVIKS